MAESSERDREMADAAVNAGCNQAELFRHQVARLERALEETGDCDQARQLREILAPSREPDHTPLIRS